MNAAVFIERDGMLNNVDDDLGDCRPPNSMSEFAVNHSAADTLDYLKEAGFLLIVTTNQPGLSTGALPRRELDLMHRALRASLPLDDILTCPHEEADDCPCHKPRAGLFLEASFKWHIELERSYVISDKWIDASAAHRIGAISMLLKSPRNGRGHHDYVLPSLNAAAEKIIHVERERPEIVDRRAVERV